MLAEDKINQNLQKTGATICQTTHIKQGCIQMGRELIHSYKLASDLENTSVCALIIADHITIT